MKNVTTVEVRVTIEVGSETYQQANVRAAKKFARVALTAAGLNRDGFMFGGFTMKHIKSVGAVVSGGNPRKTHNSTRNRKEQRAIVIHAALVEHPDKTGRELARILKAQGVYATSTFDGDIANTIYRIRSGAKKRPASLQRD